MSRRHPRDRVVVLVGDVVLGQDHHDHGGPATVVRFCCTHHGRRPGLRLEKFGSIKVWPDLCFDDRLRPELVTRGAVTSWVTGEVIEEGITRESLGEARWPHDEVRCPECELYLRLKSGTLLSIAWDAVIAGDDDPVVDLSTWGNVRH
jgi:hypothetical protein